MTESSRSTEPDDWKGYCVPYYISGPSQTKLFYRCAEGGPTDLAFREYQANLDAVNKEAKEFAASQGSLGAVWQGTKCIGIAGGRPAQGWRMLTRRDSDTPGVWVPDLRTKAGKAAADALRALSRPADRSLKALGIDLHSRFLANTHYRTMAWALRFPEAYVPKAGPCVFSAAVETAHKPLSHLTDIILITQAEYDALDEGEKDEQGDD